MLPRHRLLVALGAAVLLVGAVALLRSPPDAPDRGATVDPQPHRVPRFANDMVVLPEPAAPPAAPDRVLATAVAGGLRVSWADGLPGGAPVPGAVGYEVHWQSADQPDRVRLVAAPETQLDGLPAGAQQKIEVRAVDAFGQRSVPAVTGGAAGPGDTRWRTGLTGLLDDFTDPRTVQAATPGSRWHLSGYRGCVDLAAPGTPRRLRLVLGCGADRAVLRARQPLALTAPVHGVLGRVALLTDAAGPGGELTVDLTPGPADRVGAGRAASTPGADPALPAGTVRAVLDDTGARVTWGTGLATATGAPRAERAPARGAHVLHLVDVLVTTHGVEVRQDGRLVATGPVRPGWRSASVLLGFRGPDGRRSTVQVAGAGTSGPAAPLPQVAEVPENPGTTQVLSATGAAPGVGFARTPLVGAASARVVLTVTADRAVPPGARFQVQLGSARLPATLAVPGAPSARGSAITVRADVPAGLTGRTGPDPLSPFVLRCTGCPGKTEVVESYLEVTPGPQWTPQEPAEPAAAAPVSDAPPRTTVRLAGAGGAALPDAAVPGTGRLVLDIGMDAHTAQWDTGGVAGVYGLQVWLDGTLIAGLPTAADVPAPGGRYAVPITLNGLRPGPHTAEVRVFSTAAPEPGSVLVHFTVR